MKPRWRVGLVLGAAATILLLTLLPVEVTHPEADACSLCGVQGLADALRNVILYIPFGAAARYTGWSLPGVGVASLVLTSTAELAQQIIPGRTPAFSDVVANVAGGLVGASLSLTSRHWVLPRSPTAARLSLASALAVSAISGATALLLDDLLPRSIYYAQWTPSFADMDTYRGTVLEATLQGVPLPSHRLEEAEVIRELLLGDASLEVRIVVGPQPPRLAPVFNIADDQQRPIISVGIDRSDLLFYYRTRASELHLGQPDLRLSGGMRGTDPGDTVTIAVRRGEAGYCLGLLPALTCGLGFSVGSGWVLIGTAEQLGAEARRALGAIWALILLFPVGFWARSRWESLLAVAVVAASFLAVPSLTALRPTSGLEYLGSFVGLLAGALTRAAVARLRNSRSAAHE